MFTISHIEVSILQKYSTNKFMGHMPGDGDTKKLCIIPMLKETHNLEGRQIYNYNNINVTLRYSNIVHTVYNENIRKVPMERLPELI